MNHGGFFRKTREANCEEAEAKKGLTKSTCPVA
jgi:hypothetical protein